MNQDALAAGRAPKVSVVVPTFRRAGLLKETVDSILAQTFADFELIIVDNMSEDGTEEYVAGIGDARVRYFRNPNGGVIAVNRNYGIRRARGQYVALCDDDDLWVPEKLAKQVAVLDGAPRVALCYTNALCFGADGVERTWMVKKKVFKNHHRHLLIGNVIPNSSVLMRKEAIDAVGLFLESPEFVAVEDFDAWLKMSREHEFAYIDEALLLYRVHGMGLSSAKSKMAAKTLKVLLSVASREFSARVCFACGRAFVRYLYFKF